MNICVFVICQSCPTPGLSFKQLMKIATLQFLEVNQIPGGGFGKFSCHLICRSIAHVEFTAIDATITQHIQQVGATHSNCRWIISGYEAAATLHCSKLLELSVDYYAEICYSTLSAADLRTFLICLYQL